MANIAASELIVDLFAGGGGASVGILREFDYAEHVLEMITCDAEPCRDIHVFGLTSSGSPIHPMARGRNRIPDDAKPILWKKAAGAELDGREHREVPHG